MTKCLTCQATLQKHETKCFLCGTEVVPDTKKLTLLERFNSGAKVALIVSSLLTVASLFTNVAPPFIKCMVATVILYLVKSSAQQMWDNR